MANGRRPYFDVLLVVIPDLYVKKKYIVIWTAQKTISVSHRSKIFRCLMFHVCQDGKLRTKSIIMYLFTYVKSHTKLQFLYIICEVNHTHEFSTENNEFNLRK